MVARPRPRRSPFRKMPSAFGKCVLNWGFYGRFCASRSVYRSKSNDTVVLKDLTTDLYFNGFLLVYWISVTGMMKEISTAY